MRCSASSRSTTDDRIVGCVMFDLDDIEAAIAELEARYLAGEAAAHAHTWSVITRAFAALNRRELFPTTPDWVNIDHRRGISFAPGELTAYILAAWNLLPSGGSHRGCALAGRSRSGGHLGDAWDLARGLRRRVARDQRSDRRRRPDQPMRGIRRGRPRRRARAVRTSSAGRHRGWKTLQARVYEHFLAYFAARDWDAHNGDVGRRHVDATIAVEW